MLLQEEQCLPKTKTTHRAKQKDKRILRLKTRVEFILQVAILEALPTPDSSALSLMCHGHVLNVGTFHGRSWSSSSVTAELC